MTICLYGSLKDKDDIAKMLVSLPECAYRQIHLDLYVDYESFIRGMESILYDVIIVMANGADGMEGVFAAGSINRKIPVMWLSDDKGFGAQSYRLGTAYFHEKPITANILSTALEKCRAQSM